MSFTKTRPRPGQIIGYRRNGLPIRAIAGASDVTVDASSSIETIDTWDHVNSDASNAIIVAACTGEGTENLVTGITYGGVSLDYMGWILSNQDHGGGTAGGAVLYGKIGGLPTGSNAVVVTGFTNWAGSVTYIGADSFGDVFTSDGDSYTDVGVGIEITDTVDGGIVGAITCGGSNGGSPPLATSPATLRWSELVNNGSAAGNGWYLDQPSAGGGASSTITWTYPDEDDWWGMVGVEIRPASAAGPTMTVTATQGTNPYNGMLLRVKVLTGAAVMAAQTGGSGATSTALNTTFNTTEAGSYVYGAFSADDSEGTPAAESGTTFIDDFHETAHGEYYGSFRTTAATTTPGSVTVGSPGGNAYPGCAAQEILPAVSGTAPTEDGSAPAVVTTTDTTVTSASFTPPAGSLIVVMVGAAGEGTLTVTDTGGGLTWTQLANTSDTDDDAGGYAGVWVADVPSADGGGVTVSGAVNLKKIVLSGSSAEESDITSAIKLKKIKLSGASTEHDAVTSAIKLKKVVLSGASTEKSVVTSAINLKKIVLSASSAEHDVVTSAIKLKKIKLSGASSELSVAEMAIILKKIVLSGSSAESSVTTSAIVLKKLIFQANSEKHAQVTAAIKLKKIVLSGTSAEESVTTSAIKLKKIRLSGASTEQSAVTSAIKLKKLVFQASSVKHAEITGALHLKKLVLSGASSEESVTVSALKLKKLVLSGASHELAAGSSALVLKKLHFHGQGSSGGPTAQDSALFIFSPL